MPAFRTHPSAVNSFCELCISLGLIP
jgi:hypothetical protein